ncbi:MAG TPA: 3'-5' exonuclease, partial [Bacteroidetes bacterium]|nr:3'-5' exonuclease [Bacteroidota bacterium]
MKLNILSPIAFFDLETTGVNVAKDRIVEIAILKVLPDGKEVNYRKLVNPTIPIPEESSDIHHIVDDDVKDAPTFKDIAMEVLLFLKDCDLAGYNSDRFDVPLLMEEFLRADVSFDLDNRKLIDVQTIFHLMEQRTLTAAYRFYCKKKLEDAHSAMADVNATYEILKSQLDTYPNLKNDIGFLSDFTRKNARFADLNGRIAYNKKGEEIMNFGKFKGKTVIETFTK